MLGKALILAVGLSQALGSSWLMTWVRYKNLEKIFLLEFPAQPGRTLPQIFLRDTDQTKCQMCKMT